MLSYTDSMARHTHKNTRHSCIKVIFFSPKVHLYFFSSLFRCGFLTAVGRLPQIFPALCTHARLGKKKCREEMLTDFLPRGETKRKKVTVKAVLRCNCSNLKLPNTCS